jgi:ADP-ribose pyrophosphatase YjhB (NUDIX family)
VLLKDAHEMMGELPEEDIQRWIDEALAGLREIEGDVGNVESLEEARSRIKRWAKGFVKGGQFMPERGGSSGRIRKKLDDLLGTPEPPLHGHLRGRGEWRSVAGRPLRVPLDSHWERRMDGQRFSSPPGTTAVFVDGRPAPSAAPASPGTTLESGQAELIEGLRERMRNAEAADIERSTAARRPPVAPGDPARKIVALQDAGYTLEGSSPTADGTRLRYRHTSGAKLEVVFDGKGVQEADFTPGPVERQPRRELGRAPQSWQDFRQDALAWSDELAERFGADNHVTDVRLSQRLKDHAGTHQWSGEADLGGQVARDIERAGRARGAGRKLTDSQLRGVYASYWVAAHEISHGVNPADPNYFTGGHANLEEALTEEVSHILAVERLEEQRQTDVLEWRARNRDAIPVRGNYLLERQTLAQILRSAGINDPEERRRVVFELAFEVPPAERFERLAELVHDAQPDTDPASLPLILEDQMHSRDAQEGAVLPFMERSPGRTQVGQGYGRFRDGWLSADGGTLHLPDGGMRRIEKLPVPAEWRKAGLSDDVTDGTAIVVYPPGVETTDGLTYADGSPKNFRFLDSLDRALMILRAFLGKGSPGDPSPFADREEDVQRLEQMKGGWEWVAGVPIKQRYDGSYGVGWGVDNAVTLSSTIRSPEAAVDLAYARARGERGAATGARPTEDQFARAAGAPQSPGDVDPVALAISRGEKVDLRNLRTQRERVLASLAVGAGARGPVHHRDRLPDLGNAATPASPGTLPAPPASPGIGDIPEGAKSLLAKLLGSGGGLGADEDAIIADAFVASESVKPISNPSWEPSKKLKQVLTPGEIAQIRAGFRPAAKLLPEEEAELPSGLVPMQKGKGKVKPPPDPLIGKKIGTSGDGVKETGPIPDYSHTELTLGKGAGGSNGARWAFDTDGNRYLVKTYRGDEERVATELLANAVYREGGAAAADAGTTVYPTGERDFGVIPDVDLGEPEFAYGDKRPSSGMVLIEDGKVWIYEPRKHFGGYKHTFPKGGLEPGLSAQQNAHKEVFEETGLRAEVAGFLGDFEGDTGVTRFYLAHRTGGKPTSGAETASVKQVTIAEARELLNRERDQAVLDALETVGIENVAPPSGAPVPELPERMQVALTYPTLEGKVSADPKLWPSEAVGEDYMLDALVGNWDFVGKTFDNIMWDPEGKPFRVDQGGTFELRAMGGTKPYGPVPTEVWTMLSKGQGKRGVIVSEDSMRAQAARIGATFTPETVDRLVDAAPFPDGAMRERIRSNLKARVGWMRDFAAGKVDLPRPAEGDAAREVMDPHLEADLYPEQEDALLAYFEGMDKQINDVLRDKNASLKDAVKPVRKATRELDGLLRYAKVPGDVIAFAGLGMDPATARGQQGKVLATKTYMTASFDQGDVDAPVVLRMMVPEGSHAFYTQGFEGVPADAELLIARGPKMKVEKVSDLPDGRVLLDVTLATKASYPPVSPMTKLGWQDPKKPSGPPPPPPQQDPLA